MDYRTSRFEPWDSFKGENVATYFTRLVKLNVLVFQAAYLGLIANVINV